MLGWKILKGKKPLEQVHLEGHVGETQATEQYYYYEDLR